MTTDKPLNGIRIIDFCWVGAGSYATKLLADQGADVIKVESMTRIDGIRLSRPFAGGQPGVNRSGYFADRNTSKRSCAINMKTERGQAIARSLVETCDVVANNFTPGVMERFGLGWEDVRELNPRAVYLAMSTQGDGGPERDYLGYGMTISGLVGLHALSGLPGRLPVGTGTNYPDHIPNPCHAAFAVLAALRHARRTGRGQYIDLSQTEATLPVLGPALVAASISGTDPEPLGNRHGRWTPHGVYPCAGDDRWIAISVTSDDQFRRLVDVLGLPAEAIGGLDTEAKRRANADLIDRLVEEATRSWGMASLAQVLQDAGIPAAPVHDARGVVDSDPQLAARGHWLRLDHAEMGTSLYNAPPFRFSVTDNEISQPAPLLGEHTIEVCTSILGMPETDVRELVDEGVLT
jgi:crotonobetainyl-CoA:carnitine CoA-transferase CaiB-like acyl-CoA transferase